LLDSLLQETLKNVVSSAKKPSKIGKTITNRVFFEPALFSMGSSAGHPQADFDLRYMLADVVATGVQTGEKVSVCSHMDGVDAGATALELTTHFSKAFGVTSSVGMYQAPYMSEELKQPVRDASVKDYRLWTWLQCGELGYLQRSNAAANVDGPTARSKELSLEAYLSNCAYLFPGAKKTAVERETSFNSEFGGLRPLEKHLTRILYVKYIDDPWIGLQPNSTDIDNDRLRIAMSTDPRCAHCGMGCTDTLQTAQNRAMSDWLTSKGSTSLAAATSPATAPASTEKVAGEPADEQRQAANVLLPK